MKKTTSLILIFLIFGVIAWPFLYTQITALRENNQLDFSTIRVLRTDEKGAMYLVTCNKSAESIIKIDKSGKILKTYRIEASDKKLMTRTSDMYIDADDNLYILYTEFSQKQTEPFYAAITRLDASWNSKKLLLRETPGAYSDMKSFRFAHFSDAGNTIYGGWIFGSKASVFKFPIANNTEITMIYDYMLDKLPGIYEMLVMPEGAIMFAGMDGKVYSRTPDGKAELLYPLDRNESVPAGLCYSENGGAYFYDAHREKYISVSASHEVQTVIDSGFVLNKDNGITLSGLSSIFTSKGGRFTAAAKTNQGLKLVNGGFSFASVVENQYTQINNKPYLYMFEIMLMVILFSVLAWDFFCKVMKMRMSIILKQIIGLLSAILVILTFLLTNVSESVVKNFINDEYKSQLTNLSEILSNEIALNDITVLRNPSDSVGKVYGALASISARSMSGYQKDMDKYRKETTFSIYKQDNGKLVSVFTGSGLPAAYPVSFMNIGSDRENSAAAAMEEKKSFFTSVQDNTGRWMYMTAPLVIGGSTYGVLETGISAAEYDTRYGTLKTIFTYAVLIIAAIILVIILVTVFSTLLSIRKLSRGVEEIAEGHFDVRVNVASGDEIENLSRKFNEMASYIENYTKKLAKINKSYYRFIPEKFISMLGVKSIEDVSMHDHIKDDMAVMQFNVRSFFEIAGSMEAEEIFKFINGVFERFTPIVQSFGGIIDRFMDTGFTAVFPESPENAVNAALRIQEKLAAWNMERYKDREVKVEIGIVLHYGTVMLGVIGDGNRLSSAAVSQCLHITSALEEYGSKSNVSILATEEIVRNVPPEIFSKRYIGVVRYNNLDIDIYDFFEGDESGVRERKETTLENFCSGVDYFKKGEFYKARSMFIDVIRLLPEDGAARRYLNLSDEYYHGNKTGEGHYTV